MDNKQIGYVILEGAPDEGTVDTKVVSEAGRRVIAEACFQSAEVENRNGRCYLTADLAREISCPRTMELIQAKQLLSEAGHPMDSNLMRQQTIAPNNTCASILKLWMDRNLVMGQFKGTNNALGEAMDLDLREGVKPAFSLRALGTLRNEHGRNIVRDLKMITYDYVIFPSHKEAYTRGLVAESANLPAVGYDTANINKKGLLIPITNESVMNYIKTESANIKSIIDQIDVFYESMRLIDNDSKVQLVTKAGDTFVVNLESYIQDEIYNYCSSLV